jgi:hypothetical protein
MSVGFSGVDYALFGALIALNLRYRASLPGGIYRPVLWQWVGYAYAFLLIPLLGAIFPQGSLVLDNAAHVGGFCAGIALTWLLTRGGTPLDQAEPAYAAPAACSLAVLAAIIAVAQSGPRLTSLATRSRDHSLLLARASPAWKIKPAMANDLAWQFAIDPDATADQLQAARALAQSAAVNSTGAAFRNATDTLATIYYRQGDFATAIDLEQSLLPARMRVFANQFIHFVAADYAKNGLRELGEPIGTWGTVAVDLVQMDGRPRLRVSNSIAFPDNARLYALVTRDNTLQAMLILPLSAGHSGSFDIPLSTARAATLSGSVFTPVRVDTEVERAGLGFIPYQPEFVQEP